MAETANITPLKGENLTVLMSNSSLYHSTSCTVNLAATFEDWQTKDSGGKRKVLTGHSGSVQVDGLMCLFPATGAPESAVDSKGLITEFNKGVEVDLAVTIDTVVYTTKAWITNASFTGPVAQNATYSATFEFEKLTPKS